MKQPSPFQRGVLARRNGGSLRAAVTPNLNVRDTFELIDGWEDEDYRKLRDESAKGK